MLERTFGHYARVLVDVDLAKKLIFKILVERKGFAFFVDVEYENLPPFCDHCKVIGHKFDNSKRRKESTTISRKHVHSKQFVPGQPKDKVDETINVEGSSSKQYSQVNHVLERIEADKHLEEDINKDSDSLSDAVEVLIGDKPATSPNFQANSQQNYNSDDVLVVNKPVSNASIQAEITPVNSQEISSALQVNLIDNNQNDNEVIDETQDDANQTPLLVQQDIQFLKESWANLADIEDQTVLPSLNLANPLTVPPLQLDKPPDKFPLDVNKHADNVSPCTTDNDGFQLVTHRKKPDKHKPIKTSAPKSIFITSSKVGSPKPFK
jgi:hypothetical protein